MGSSISAHSYFQDQPQILEIDASYSKFLEFRLSDPEKAKEHAILAYQIALEQSDSIWVTKTTRAIGWVYGTLGEYDTGFYYLAKSIEYGEALNDEAHLKFVYNDAGLNRLNLSIYDQSLDFFLSSLNIREKGNDPEELSIIYNNIGLVYYHLKDYKKAISYHVASFKLHTELENAYMVSVNMANIGLCHLGNKEYQIALDYFLKVEKNCTEDCPIDALIQSLGGIGIINYENKDYDRSKKYFVKSNQLSIDNDILQYLPSNYNYMSLGFFEKLQVDSALIYLNKAHEIALQLEDIQWISKNLELYSRIYAYKDNFEKALIYHQQYVTLKDSMYNDEVIRNLTEIHVEEQKTKDETIILGKDLQITERNQQLILFGATIILSMILVFLLYRNNKFRRRLNEKLDYKVKERTETLNTTNEALIDSRTELDNFIYKISHDIQGPLATLKGVCDIGLIDVKDQTGREYLTRLSTTAEELNDIILRLQRVNQIISTTIDYQIVDFKSLIDTAVTQARKHSSASDTIVTKVNIQKDLNFKTDIDLISIVINNLIGNAFQFYDNSKVESIIEITVRGEQQRLSIDISDNGIGIEVDDTNDLFRMFSRFSDRNRTGGIGLFLVKTTVDKLSGKISVRKDNPDEDTVFTVELPYEILEENADGNNTELPRLTQIG